MGELKRGERLQIMLTDEELTALDDWRFAARMPSRAAAIRELLKRGLAAEGRVDITERTSSRDYGVLRSGNASSGEYASSGESDDAQQHRQTLREPRRPDGRDKSE
jgi:hypothetical protein